mmetsp:Transcript_654/g.2386  ORF Transcript_654/g.2386 Transcript_654/m.2386 type:complete len:221 (+) Transcript_654:4327-4989(+)
MGLRSPRPPRSHFSPSAEPKLRAEFERDRSPLPPFDGTIPGGPSAESCGRMISSPEGSPTGKSVHSGLVLKDRRKSRVYFPGLFLSARSAILVSVFPLSAACSQSSSSSGSFASSLGFDSTVGLGFGASGTATFGFSAAGAYASNKPSGCLSSAAFRISFRFIFVFFGRPDAASAEVNSSPLAISPSSMSVSFESATGSFAPSTAIVAGLSAFSPGASAA